MHVCIYIYICVCVYVCVMVKPNKPKGTIELDSCYLEGRSCSSCACRRIGHKETVAASRLVVSIAISVCC